MTSIAITYKINPPAQTKAGDLSTSKTSSIPVSASLSEGQKKYCDSLHEAIRRAKDELGSDLTVWRDAVGKAEETKETEALNYGEEEEMEEEDEQ